MTKRNKYWIETFQIKYRTIPQFYWHIRCANGEILQGGEGYTRKATRDRVARNFFGDLRHGCRCGMREV